MQYSPQFQPPSPRKSAWIPWVLAGVLAVALIVVLVVVLTKSDTPSTPFPGPNATSQGAQAQKQERAPLADVYTGRSMNHTAKDFGMDGSAKLRLRFTNKNPNSLAGEIEVNGRDVRGTGLFEGTLSEGRISLHVSPRDGAPSYQLTGMLTSGGAIQGSLTVPLGELSQSGEWQVQPEQ